MRRLWLLILCLTLATGAAKAATLCETRTGFAADRSLVVDGHSYNGKIWAMPGEERHEQAIQAFRPIFLLRNGDAPGEVVLPELKTVVEFSLPPELRILGDPALKKHPIGEETVNGIATTKYAIDESVPEGRATGTLWLSRDGIPMRLSGSLAAPNGRVSTIRWELSHVRIGPQPASLFVAPTGFSRLPAEAVAPLLGLRLKSASR